MRISDWSSDVCSSDLSILREAADWRLRKIPVRALYPLCALLLSFVLPLASASDQALWEHSTLNQILKRGELRAGVEAGYMPFEMRDSKSKIIGFDVDLARLMARYMGVRLTLSSTQGAGTLPELMTEHIKMLLGGTT